MLDLRTIHKQRNAESRARWTEFAPHRSRVTDCLIQSAGRCLSVAPFSAAPFSAADASSNSQSVPIVHNTASNSPAVSNAQARSNAEVTMDFTPRLCVLGAGNCNDLDLAQLVKYFREIHLIDIDSDSLQAAADRHETAVRGRLHLHGEVDLSGLVDCMDANQSSPEALLRAIDSAPLPAVLNGAFDVVASICTLTQILEIVLRTFEPTHSHFLPLVQALRLRHLKQLSRGLKPGGRGVLITDVVSSETCAELATIADWQLPGLLQQLVATRNFFTGVNPLILWQLLATGGDRELDIDDVAPLSPWTWNLGPRVYAVCGWTFRRRPTQ